MLARSGRLPMSGDYAYEVKWDGFRALVGSVSGLRVRSRRGWDMTERVPELDGLPSGVFDGELVSFEDGLPSFSLVCEQAAGNIGPPPLA
jgi:ATP-dependent DNA ligase